jgi:oxidase EvaA
MIRFSRQVGPEAAFLRSHLALSGQCPSVEDAYAWYLAQKNEKGFETRVVPLSDVDGWEYGESPRMLYHRSGRFFALVGVRVETTFGPVKSWDQPIIHQPEIGILGFLTRKFEGIPHFLVQAKREPGNINVLQLAPTVQATWSNYTRVHKGKDTPYLEFFTSSMRSRTLLDHLQTEQGSRFLGKRNRNMIVETTHDVEVNDPYRWMTLGQIKALMHVDNVVNMDARSVLSLIPLVNLDGCLDPCGLGSWWEALGQRGLALCSSTSNTGQEHSSMEEILAWLNNLKTRHSMNVSRVPLDQMRHWTADDASIRHETGQHFSVIGLDVEACCRETLRWSQPILHHPRRGLRGFLLRTINGVLHFLARASLEPGSHNGVEVGPTVSCSDCRERLGGRLAPRLLEHFIDPKPEDVFHRCVQSEEGGRFHHFENEYLFLQAPPDMPHPGPHYRWMSLGQLLRLARHGHVNMEARNLLSCLSVLPETGKWRDQLKSVSAKSVSRLRAVPGRIATVGTSGHSPQTVQNPLSQPSVIPDAPADAPNGEHGLAVGDVVGFATGSSFPSGSGSSDSPA